MLRYIFAISWEVGVKSRDERAFHFNALQKMNINFLLQLACVTQECSTYLNSTHTFLICLKQMYSFAHVLRFSALRANKTRHVTGLKSCFKPNKSEQRQRQGCQSALVTDCWWVQHIPALEPSPFPGGQEGWTCLLSPDSTEGPARSLCRSSADCSLSLRCWAP